MLEVKLQARYSGKKSFVCKKKKKKKSSSLIPYVFTNNKKYRNCYFFDKITRAKQDKLIQCVYK